MLNGHHDTWLAEAFGLDLAEVKQLKPPKRRARVRNGRAQWRSLVVRWGTIAGVVLLVHTAQNADHRT